MDGNVFTLSFSLWNIYKHLKFLLNTQYTILMMITITTTVFIIIIVNQSGRCNNRRQIDLQHQPDTPGNPDCLNFQFWVQAKHGSSATRDMAHEPSRAAQLIEFESRPQFWLLMVSATHQIKHFLESILQHFSIDCGHCHTHCNRFVHFKRHPNVLTQYIHHTMKIIT